MRLGRNLLAGLTNSIWSAIVGLAVVPFYLKYLGIEAYGLIGFFVTMQAVLQLLDLGLAPTINREVARCSTIKNMQGVQNLLHTLAVIYWGAAVLMAALIYFAAPYITKYWLQSKGLPQETILHSVIYMGLIVACRWPVGLYTGALMGAQRLTISSGVNIAIVSLGNIGAVFVLAFVSPTIQAFFLWQVGVGLVYAASMRWAAWHIVGRTKDICFEFNELRRIWRFSAGMTGVAVSGVILLQLDKVLLSKMLSLDDFGRYTLATVVASGLYVLLTPLFNTIYPRMSALVAKGDTEKLVQFYKLGTRLFLAVLFPIAITISVFADNLLFLWTGNKSLAFTASPIVSLLLIGTALNGAMHFPYALQLAYGQSKLPLKINIILITIMIPAIIIFVNTYGALGGAAAWAFTNLVYLFIGAWITHNKLLRGITTSWLFGDVGLPMMLALLFSGLGGILMRYYNLPFYLQVFFALVLMCLAFLMTIIGTPELKVLIREARSNIKSARAFS